MADLEALETWLSPLLQKLDGRGRAQLARKAAQQLRRSQQQRICAQVNPDGSPFEARKPRDLRGKKDRIKRRMFEKIGMARYLKAKGTSQAAYIGFTERVSRIALVHQDGLRDRADPGAPLTRYPRRKILGLSNLDISVLRSIILTTLNNHWELIMSLDLEINTARKEIVSDGYDMSIGELANLYKTGEIKIQPEFQRLYRWDITRQTRFIESLLLGLPIPPIFVYQDTNGIWELIDGLQRLSTIFEFMGILTDANGKTLPPSTLEGTRFIPSLASRKWEPSSDTSQDGIGVNQQLQIKRARMRVEILKQESDPQAKYELFQRLNTGGDNLSEQEIRNCIAIMLNPDIHKMLIELSENTNFKETIQLTETALEKQAHVELVLRLIAFRHIKYDSKLDVHEYLDQALFSLATDGNINLESETENFEKTFEVLNKAMADKTFKRFNGTDFGGKFLMSVYEVVALGTSANIDEIISMGEPACLEFLREKCENLWQEPVFIQNSGAGIRGTTRLTNLLPLAAKYFKP